MNRVIRIADVGEVQLAGPCTSGVLRRDAELSAPVLSSRLPKTLGESKRGQQNQSTEPSLRHQRRGLQVSDEAVVLDRG